MLYFRISCRASSSPAAPGGGAREAVVAAPVTAARPAAADPAPLRAIDLRLVVADADWGRPVWSPDGANLALSSRHLDALAVVPAEGGAPRELVRAAHAGYAPEWTPDGGALAYRAPGQRSGDVPLLSVRLDGGAGAPPRSRTPGVRARVLDDAVVLRSGATERRVSPPGDRHCCAVVSPDGRFVAFQGLVSGLSVHDRETGRTHGLGPGGHAAFAPDGRRLAFDRTADDGERLTSATLHLADLPTDDPDGVVWIRDVAGTPALARFPSFAPDGGRLAFEAEGGVWTARVDGL